MYARCENPTPFQFVHDEKKTMFNAAKFSFEIQPWKRCDQLYMRIEFHMHIRSKRAGPKYTGYYGAWSGRRTRHVPPAAEMIRSAAARGRAASEHLITGRTRGTRHAAAATATCHH